MKKGLGKHDTDDEENRDDRFQRYAISLYYQHGHPTYVIHVCFYDRDIIDS